MPRAGTRILKAVAAIAAIVALGSLSSSSCYVARLSDSYACSSDDQCKDGRTCDQGFCVETPCPAECTSCDLPSKICRIDCMQNRACGDVTCPIGYDCRISCSRAGSCGRITCGPGPCDVTCGGAGACPSVDCRTSCACDVHCNNATACLDMMCPMVVATECTQDGSAGSPCDSSASVCDTCI